MMDPLPDFLSVLRATSRVVAREWGPEGTRVNAICPATSGTPALKEFLTRAEEHPGMDAHADPTAPTREQ